MIPIEEIRQARRAIAGDVVRTPLVRLEAELDAEVYLKLENLQPIGAFKLRGALGAVSRASAGRAGRRPRHGEHREHGPGGRLGARLHGIPCTVVVPEQAAEGKIAAIERLGGRVIRVPHERWWQALMEATFPGVPGLFVHPVQDAGVMAGNGTIGLEILEDLPDPDIVLIPFGGGGLTAGVASAIKALRPQVEVYPVEPDTAAPLAASLAAGEPREIEYRPSFVDGAGGRAVLPAMWPIVREVVDGSFTASLDETARAVRTLVERNRIVAEGAAALPVAVALERRVGSAGQKVVCVVSGGNIDAARLATILGGGTPD